MKFYEIRDSGPKATWPYADRFEPIKSFFPQYPIVPKSKYYQ